MKTKQTIGWSNNYLLVETNDDTFEVLGWRHNEPAARLFKTGEIIDLDTEEIGEEFAHAMETFQRWIWEG